MDVKNKKTAAGGKRRHDNKDPEAAEDKEIAASIRWLTRPLQDAARKQEEDHERDNLSTDARTIINKALDKRSVLAKVNSQGSGR